MISPEVAEHIAQLRDEDQHVRWKAAEALARDGVAAAVPALIEAMRDVNDEVRYTAIRALGKIGHAFAAPALIRGLAGDDMYVRYYSAAALRDIGLAAVPVLSQAANARDKWIRRVAVTALREIAGAGAIPILIRALSDPDGDVCQRAAGALKEIGADAIPALIDVIRGRERQIRRAAIETLAKIGNSFVLPRKILAATQFSAQQRVDLLESLRRLRSDQGNHALLYDFPDTRTLCQSVLSVPHDADVRAGAQTVLNWLNGDSQLLVASRAAGAGEAKELLRGAQPGSPASCPEDLLRATDDPASRTDAP